MKRQPTALKSVIGFACAVALAVGLSACQSTTGPEEPAPEPEPQPASEFMDEDISDQAPREPETIVAEPMAAPELDVVYFDFDDASIRADARPALRQNAERLRGYVGSITIEGHCDERGNEEYNLALGERRADAVREYLANLGVSSSRLRVVSYGEAKPAVMGHNESAWKYNRRAEFRTDR